MKILPSIFAYLFFLVLLAIVPATMHHNGYAEWLVPNFWLVFFYMSGLTFILLAAILFVQHKNQEYYVHAFLAGTTVKILGCIFFIIIFLAKNAVNKHVFLADF